MNSNLLDAILSMDAYSRGIGSGQGIQLIIETII